jgi:hypothetical protein
MVQDKIEIDVGNEMRLDKLLGRLDKMGLRERGFFRAVRKGRQAVTLLLNGDRLDIAEARRTVIRGDRQLSLCFACRAQANRDVTGALTKGKALMRDGEVRSRPN